MTAEFDELEKDIMADMRNIYTEIAIDHAMNPRNVGSMPKADGFGSVTGSCGDTMQIWLMVRNNTIIDATFWTDGCGASIAAGSMVTGIAKEKSIWEAKKITCQDVLDGLGGLPEENLHCALLATDTLREAIKGCLNSKSGAQKIEQASPK